MVMRVVYGAETVAIPATSCVDLHMHSPVSDGFWTPDTLPQAAAALGIKVLALTDHDEFAGVPAMAAACKAQGIHLISGAEFSVTYNGIGFHMLGYNFDLANPALKSYIEGARRYYEDMVANAIRELARQGKPLDAAKSPGLNNRPLKVYHLVAALIENGYAKNMSEAYGICNKVGAHYGWTSTMQDMIALVHGAGGVAVIAHPGRAEPGFTTADEAKLNGMRAAGLDGIEVYHPYHTPKDNAFYYGYAEHHHMLVSCGSDSHGPGQSRRMLTPWPLAFCRQLIEACGVVVQG